MSGFTGGSGGGGVSWLGTALQAFGAAKEGMDASSALKYNSGIYAEEARTAAAQGYEQEAQTRRQTAGELGREEAAAGEAGAGYGGSTGRMIGQSALNAELDALNVRYKSQLQKWAYNAQSANLANEAGTVRTGGFLKAGAALLRGKAGGYLPGSNDEAVALG